MGKGSRKKSTALRMNLRELIAASMLFICFSCEVEEQLRKPPSSPEELIEYNKFKITIEQGISGTVLFQEGNCGPVLDTTSCKAYAVARKIKVYEFTTREQTEPAEGAFYTEVHTRLITTVQSDEEGFYEVALEPGKYSMFIEEKGQLYANLTGQDGGILVSKVDSGWVTLTHPEITYKAVY